MSNTQNQEFLGFMSRHLVALTGEYESFQSDGQRLHHGVFAFSGWILSLRNQWFWTTAGHCLREYLEEPIKNGTLRVVQSGFADYFGLAASHVHTYPFTYQLGDGFYIEKADMGLDFGLIHLPDLVRMNLEANGIVAVSRENWTHQGELAFSHYKMLGLPSQPIVDSTFERADGSMGAYLQPVMIAVDRMDYEDVTGTPANTWYLGRIPSDVTIPSIEGMSGGPIYGFRQHEDGRWYYHIVALQSRWRPESRILFGCSVPLFAEAVYTALE